MHIHVLGLGPIGSLTAHYLRLSLARQFPITLIHRSKRFDECVIQVENNGVVTSSDGYGSEVFDEKLAKRDGSGPWELRGLDMPENIPEPVDPPQAVEFLIIATKAYSTLPALARLLPRLSSYTTVVLLQNGLGVYEQLVQEIFRNPETRPQFILASNTHGAWLKDNGRVVHAGIGEIEFGIVPDPLKRDFEASLRDERVPKHKRRLHIDDICKRDDPLATRYQSLRFAVATLSAAETLNAVWKPIHDIRLAMRRKLVVNAVINPLTALMNCRNGELFTQEASMRMMRKICSEASAAYAGELTSATRSVSELWKDEDNGGQIPIGRLPQALEQVALEMECLRVADKTKGNNSSMLMDIRQGRPTEIDFINGHLLQLGTAHGVPMPANAILLDLIKMRSAFALG